MRLNAVQLLLLVCACTMATLNPAIAADGIVSTLVQDKATVTQVSPSDPAAVRELVSRLSDKEVRGLLIERLDLVAQEKNAKQEQQSTYSALFATLDKIRLHIIERTVKLPQLLRPLITLKNRLIEKSKPDSLPFAFVVLSISIFSGLACRWGFCLLTEKLQLLLDRGFNQGHFYKKLATVMARFVLAFISAIVFIFVALTVAEALLSPATFEFADTILRKMMALSMLAYACFGVILSPSKPHRRLLNLDDWHAKFIHRNITAVVTLIGFTGAWFTICSELELNQLASVTGFWINLAVYFYFAFIAWRAREGFSSILRHEDDTPSERQAAQIYPYFIIIVILFTWLLVEGLAVNNAVHLILDGRHYPFMALLIWAPAMDSAIRALVHHIKPPIDGEGTVAERAHQSSKRSYIRIGRVLLVGIVLNSVMDIWQLNFVDIASASIGNQYVVRLIDTLWTILTGYFIWEVTTLWINLKLAAEQTASGTTVEAEIGGEGGGTGGSRLSTVLPLLRWAVQTFITATTVLLALGQLGIDTTPLLAGAGVVGLAIGFGAQKLVTDVVSGIFFLIDDAFRAGEYVDVEGTVGTVEKISLRSMQLRHHRGPVHTIPYGEIPKVTNFSRDWVIMKLRFTVPFDTDLHKVKKIFKKIGADLMEVPEYAQDLLATFKSQGVIEVDDVGIVIRGKFTAKPGKQFTLRKEIYQRVQQAFDENGLQFARKEVRVKLDGLSEDAMSDESKHTIAAAAADAADPAK